MNNYPRGSEWRKWDLHVHTPFSYLNNQFGNDFDEYVIQLFKKAIEKNIIAIGITDYFCIEGYKKIKKEYLENEDKLNSLFTDDEIKQIKNILILPNIEFRLNKLVGSNRINFHVIFSDKVSIKDIEENFLHEIEFVYEGHTFDQDEKWKLKLNNIKEFGKKLIEEQPELGSNELFVGMKCAVVNDSQIMQILVNNKSKFLGNYIIIVPSDEDLSDIDWKSQDHNVRKVLIQKANCLFASNPNTIKWGIGKFNENKDDYIKEFKSLKPCIWGSDAHSYDKLFEPDEQKYTWIKADPTFEGLKQIIYEPEERVKIQKENPQKDYSKHYFSKISINDTKIFVDGEVSFKKTEIPLNPNLVAIIGGRGTGKSLLLDSIAKTFQKNDEKNIVIENDDFSITYTKSDGTSQNYNIQSENVLDYLHIPQGYVKNIVDPKNPNRLDKEIKELLNLPEKPQNIKYEESSINRLIDELFEIKDFLNKKMKMEKK